MSVPLIMTMQDSLQVDICFLALVLLTFAMWSRQHHMGRIGMATTTYAMQNLVSLKIWVII